MFTNIEQYHRKISVLRYEQLLHPTIHTMVGGELVKKPILHFIPDNDGVLGVEPRSNALLFFRDGENALSDVYVNHVMELSQTRGFQGTSKNEKALVKSYFTKYPQFSRVFKLETALRSVNPVIMSYGLLEHLYPIKQRRRDVGLDRTNDLLHTQISNVKSLLKVSDRNQYLFYRLPKSLDDKTTFVELFKKPTLQKWLKFNERRDVMLADLLAWFYKDTEYKSPLESLSYQEAEKIVIILQEDNQFISLNLAWLKQWRGDLVTTDKGEVKPKNAIVNSNDRLNHLYAAFVRLVELRSDVDADSMDEPSLWETLEKSADGTVDSVDTDYTKEINTQLNELVKAGRLSRRELTFLQKQSVKYQSLPNPFGEGTLEQLLDRPTDELKNIPVEITEDIKSVVDKSYLKSSIIGFDSAYTKERLQKDIVATTMQLQNVGLPITDFKVVDVEDAVNSYKKYTIQTTPINGKVRTFTFEIPNIQEDGTFMSNGVVCRMDKQRADAPIKKTGSHECALTSAMSKCFVRRCPKVAYDYDGWLQRKVLLMTSNENGKPSITNIRVGKPFDHTLTLPYAYTILAKKFYSFTKDDYQFCFDYHHRKEFFDGVNLALYEKDSQVVVAYKDNRNVITVNSSNVFYQYIDGKRESLGSIESVLDIDVSSKPQPFAEVKVNGRSVPVGVMLSYLLGFDKFMSLLRVKYRTLDKNERYTPLDNEFLMKTRDVKVVIEIPNNTVDYLIGGFSYFASSLLEVDLSDLNHKSGYSGLFNSRQISEYQQKEFSLMETMWVDPITKDILHMMKEPIETIPLFVRAVELITTDNYPSQISGKYMVDKGYSRMVEILYKELLVGVRGYLNDNVRQRAQMSIKPNAVKLKIISDPGVSLSKQPNPVQVSKERERVTFNGAGGRSAQTMMGASRRMHSDDIGFVSEGNVDSGKVGTVFQTTANPTYDSLYGTKRDWDRVSDGIGSTLTPNGLLMPFGTYDDKRL